MKKLALLLFVLPLAMNVQAGGESKEKPVQHIKVKDVTTMQDAKKIFVEKTSDIKSKTKLDAQELQQIHFITYTLEKSVAYYAENLKGDEQKLAKEIADVVENIHISSENNRQKETKKHLDTYFKLAEKFVSHL
ncbi:DUF6746 family protein [Pleionea sp. CnH1-48]|uniref:DUF6746 family protein n=1 Tax=Pleionea sp. CnH1-48 TaxID=2954494 RepID=UPI0020968926|nr:DUF6746 family protein [Pleionea sp. CnH1-48]MCO7224365.1 hypothetical protein [Pleionea sp. CnH1-48]